MSIKEIIAGGAITLVIGGTAYTTNQADVVNNFANDTGLTQQQAEQYVNDVKEEDLVSYDELGASYITEGQDTLAYAKEVDCVNYEYEWESSASECEAGKTQLNKTGNNAISLGESYKILDSKSSSKNDISTTIRHIDNLNADYESTIIRKILGQSNVDEAKKTNSYNKALLKAALDSN